MRRLWLGFTMAVGCTFQTKIDEIDVQVGTADPPTTATTPTPPTSTPTTTPTTEDTASTPTDGVWFERTQDAQLKIALDDVPACTGLDPAEWLEITFATAHGGPIVGTYDAFDGDGLLYDQRTFRATQRVGGTGTGLSALGDVLEITAFDAATGRLDGEVDLAGYGIWTFGVDRCP